MTVVAAVRLRRRVCTEVDAPCEQTLQVALCGADELLAYHWGAVFPIDVIPIPERYMPQANASEAEPQEQTMGNDSVETRETFSVYKLEKF